MYRQQNKKSSRKKTLITLLVVVLVATLVGVGVWYFWLRQDGDSSSPVVTDSAIKEEEAEKSDSTPPPRDGGVVDTSDQDDGSEQPESGSGISSESGKITVYQPAENAMLQNDGTLKGASSYNTVSYRIIDDAIGVIGTGSLKVVNGKFSGTFSFNSNGKEGRLDVFRALDTGREIDVIEIPVRFK